MSSSSDSRLGFGLGLRPTHYQDVLEGRSQASWFEVVTENFLGDGGRPLHILELVRRERPVVLHGVSLNIGSTDPLDRNYLARLRNLVNRIEPAHVSDHVCFTGVEGENLHDLLPLPYTEETLSHLVPRILQVQEFLGRRLFLENVSSYLTYVHSEMSEWDFLAELARRADCGLVLDINNVYVSSVNHGFDPKTFLDAIPRSRVGYAHLAGHSTQETDEGKTYLIDTHDHPVCEEVWELYAHAVRRFGALSTMVEWDAEIPEYAKLQAELDRAQQIQEDILRAQKRTHAPRASKELPRGDHRI
ncbi:MAG: MNIO family bufferin maturase [Bdellovibrionota bacterium]